MEFLENKRCMIRASRRMRAVLDSLLILMALDLTRWIICFILMLDVVCSYLVLSVLYQTCWLSIAIYAFDLNIVHCSGIWRCYYRCCMLIWNTDPLWCSKTASRIIQLDQHLLQSSKSDFKPVMLESIGIECILGNCLIADYAVYWNCVICRCYEMHR